MKTFDSIDTGNDTLAAKNYAARMQRMLDLASGTIAPEPSATQQAPQAEVAPVVSLHPKSTSLVEALGLQESSEAVEVILNFTTDKSSAASFSVVLKPIAINITDDCVTLLIDSGINIKPPTLIPLIIKKSGVLYNVVYAGTVLQTPKLNVLSFLRTQN